MKFKIISSLVIVIFPLLMPFTYWHLKTHDPVQLAVIQEGWLWWFGLVLATVQVWISFSFLRDVWKGRLKLKPRNAVAPPGGHA